ncbi:hypothetical protein FRC08_004499 [Ceratobasidium sp. 394]|nr:hypothetical protein FRC08_004499 [Ceratobasidium sp. 394]
MCQASRARREAAAAEQIGGDPHVGDDTLARKPLTEFFPPTPTGSTFFPVLFVKYYLRQFKYDEVDQTNYDQARIEYLTHYLVVRHGIDIRSAIGSEKLELAELEEIYVDPEAADEREVEGYNWQREHLKTAIKPQQVQTGYTGITVDQDSYTVTAKYTQKGAASNRSSNKRSVEAEENGLRKDPRVAQGPQRTREVENGPPQQPAAHHGATPLRRADSTTYVDRRRIDLPVYFPRDKIPRSPNTTALWSITPPRFNPRIHPLIRQTTLGAPPNSGSGTHITSTTGNTAFKPKAAPAFSQPAHNRQHTAANSAPRTSSSKAHHTTEPRPHSAPVDYPPDRKQRDQSASDNRQQHINPTPSCPSNTTAITIVTHNCQSPPHAPALRGKATIKSPPRRSDRLPETRLGALGRVSLLTGFTMTQQHCCMLHIGDGRTLGTNERHAN